MTTPYKAGQISLVNGQALVTGIGTGWATSLIVGGTIFVEVDGGNALPILPDDSATTNEHPITDTKLTAAIAWTGPTGTYDYALVRDTAYGQQTVANAQALADYIQRLNNTTLSAVAGVNAIADTLLLFTGPDTATTIPLAGLINGADYNVQVDTLAGRAVYDSSAANFRVLVSDIGDGRAAIYSKNSSSLGDWSDPAIITGTGPAGPYTTINAGNVTTLAPGSQATATFVPVSTGVVRLDLGLPAGQNGTGTGTVTSIAVSVPTGLSVSGSPITSSGTFAFTWSAGYQGYTTTEATKLSSAATLNTEDQVLTGGARVTSKDLGAVASGTLTLDPGDRPLQHYTNNGAHTLSPGSNTGSFMLDITNGASAGAITLTGWAKVTGDAFTTTSGNKFRLHCSIGNAGSLLIVQACSNGRFLLSSTVYAAKEDAFFLSRCNCKSREHSGAGKCEAGRSPDPA